MKIKRIRGKRIPVRLPLPQKTGGVHIPKKGMYDRERDRKAIARNWQQEADRH